MRWLNTLWLILCLAILQGSPGPVTHAAPVSVSDNSTTGKAIRPGELQEVSAHANRLGRSGPPTRDPVLDQNSPTARLGSDAGIVRPTHGRPVRLAFPSGREQMPRAPPHMAPRTT